MGRAQYDTGFLATVPQETREQGDDVQDDDSQVNRIAAAFVAARRSGLPLASFPGAIPPDLAAAYRIQAVAIANH